MAVAIPHNALLHDDNSHLYCEVCKEPLHDELMQDVIQLSIEAVREQMRTGDQHWASARGEENWKGKGAVTRIRAKDIDPVYVQALDEVRDGLSQYPLQGGLQLRHDDGSHILEHIWRQQTGSIPASKSHVNSAIGQFIRNNEIKGHTTKDTHGLSSMDKMWGPSEDTPTWGCPMGTKLRGVDGSVCEGCYVDNIPHLKSDSVQSHQIKNLLGLANPQMYAAALSWQLGQANHDMIRLNSSGDIQNAHHFALLSDVAAAHPDKKFWLSTREHEQLGKFMESGGRIPANLTVRVSQHMQHQTVHDSEQMRGLMASHPNITGSSVNASHKYGNGEVWVCPAAGETSPNNTCEAHNCDACWDPSIKAIDYTGHGSKKFHHSLEDEQLSAAELNQVWTKIQLQDKEYQRQIAASQGIDAPDISAFMP
jgi:hypothetical protein